MSPGPEQMARQEVRSLLAREYGLALPKLTRQQLERAVRAAERAGASRLTRGWCEAVLDNLPIDESWLFRDDPLWRWLRDDVIPGLLARRSESGAVRVLSVGCAGGQEVVSVAALLKRGGAPLERAIVLGIDPSPARIARAASGILDDWSVSRADKQWCVAADVVAPNPDGRWRVRPEVQALCRYEVGNLLEWAAGHHSLAQYDVVLCRHVLIYFQDAQARRVLTALAERVRVGGLLVVAPPEAHLLSGHSSLESTHYLAARVRRRPGGREGEHRRSAECDGVATDKGAGGEGESGEATPRVSALAAASATAKAQGDGAATPGVVQQWLEARELAPRDPARARVLLDRLVAELRTRGPGDAVEGTSDLSVAQLLTVALPLLTYLEERR